MELQLTIEQVKALLVIAPKSDKRHYVNGALLEVRDDRVWLVATDGSRLLIIHPTARIQGDDCREGQWIIPRDLLAGAKAKKGESLTLSIDDYQGAQHCARARIITGNGILSAPTIDGVYPDWRRVVPSQASGERAHYDPAYVGDFGIVAELLNGARLNMRIHYNGTNAAPVGLGTADALGLLMPFRDEHRPYERPDWTR